MDYLIVSDSHLIRLANRLMHVLRTCYNAESWAPTRFARERSELASGVRVIFVGELWEQGGLSEPPSPRGLQRLGVSWWVEGRHAAIWTGQRQRDGKAAFDALERALKRLDEDAEQLLEALPAHAIARSGPHLMRLYLDKNFQVPAETVRGMVDFSMDRLLWERRHLVGIASFLCEGFDDL